MAFEEGTEKITCPDCGMLHKAKWYRLPVREPIKVHCKACDAVMRSAKTVRDYYDVQQLTD